MISQLQIRVCYTYNILGSIWKNVPNCFLSYYIVIAFIQGEISNVSLNNLPESMHIRIGYTCEVFLQCEFSNVGSNRLP